MNEKEALELIQKYDPNTAGYSLLYAIDENLLEKKEIVIAILQKNGYYLNKINERFKEDRDIILSASKSIIKPSFDMIPKKYQSDKEIVINMASQIGRNFDALQDDHKNDRDIILALAKKDTSGYYCDKVNKKFKNDKEIVIEAIKTLGYKAYKNFASQELQHDMDVVVTLLIRNPELLENNTLANDKNIVKEVIKHNWEAIKYAGEEIKHDKSITDNAISQNPRAILYLSDELQEEYKDIYISFIRQIEKTAEEAAEWWIEQIKGLYDSIEEYDYDLSMHPLKHILAFDKTALCSITEEQEEKFKKYITTYIKKSIIKDNRAILKTEYNPVGILKEAQTYSEIKAEFPLQTHMHIIGNDIIVNGKEIERNNNNKIR